MINMLTIVEKCKMVCKHTKTTQREFARIAEMKESTLSTFMNQTAECPQAISLKNLHNICVHFGIDLTHFVECKPENLFDKIEPVLDADYSSLTEFIRSYMLESSADERTWFLVQFKKAFPEYSIFSEKKKKTS